MSGDPGASVLVALTTAVEEYKKQLAERDQRIRDLEQRLVGSAIKSNGSGGDVGSNGSSNGSEAGEVAALKAQLGKADEVYRKLQASYRELAKKAASTGAAQPPAAPVAPYAAAVGDSIQLAEVKSELKREKGKVEELRADLRKSEGRAKDLEARFAKSAAEATDQCRAFALKIAQLETGGVSLGKPPTAMDDDDDIQCID